MSPEQSAALIESCWIAKFSHRSFPIAAGVRYSRLAFHSSVCVAFPVGTIWVAESLV
jgi:hypothetical protein